MCLAQQDMVCIPFPRLKNQKIHCKFFIASFINGNLVIFTYCEWISQGSNHLNICWFQIMNWKKPKGNVRERKNERKKTTNCDGYYKFSSE